ncbi:MAG: S8 family serine peptidase [Bacteroidetes bacterium]|nr:S8 family serine peptidase [Bacteroidota bacterium]MDA0902872.1 S8 family serine peptidase [Bacteroidota bacterium]MDA1241975.1 S8 family serine peptidase [Bacteroidota bacterium]
MIAGRPGLNRVKRSIRVAMVLAMGCHQVPSVWAQIGPQHVLVELNDKTWGDTYGFDLDHPEAFLSQRSLQRRNRQRLAVDSLDLPVSLDIIDALNASKDWEVLHASKWMSSVVLIARDSTADTSWLGDLPFVARVKSMPRLRTRIDPIKEVVEAPKNLVSATEYGLGWTPLTQLHAEPLHALGFQGQGMWIGVLDAGFQGIPDLDAFKTLRESDRLIVPEGGNVAHGGSSVFQHSRHGASILGTMACHWPDSLIGTAPQATYVLYVTEDVTMERLLEEEHWIVAAEDADARGVDLLNTSLGYSVFDDSLSNHAVGELNGATARISVASAIAASRGMLVVTSAGNNGDDPWHFITFPADARDVIAVGAVNALGEHAWFSGYGPSSDGRVKPEVMAHGASAAYPRFDGRVGTGNGTSFASPILCGAAACLWQAHPLATASEVRDAIIRSSHMFNNPSPSMGHGIPDFWLAHQWLQASLPLENEPSSPWVLFPNPVSPQGTLRWMARGDLELNSGQWHWNISNALGQEMVRGETSGWSLPRLGGHVDLAGMDLRPGTYVFSLRPEGEAVDSHQAWSGVFIVQ